MLVVNGGADDCDFVAVVLQVSISSGRIDLEYNYKNVQVITIFILYLQYFLHLSHHVQQLSLYYNYPALDYT